MQVANVWSDNDLVQGIVVELLVFVSVDYADLTANIP